MIRGLFHRGLRRFAKRYEYDATYMVQILDADLVGFLKFYGLIALSAHRFGLPLGPFFAAKFIATRAADCGTCVELVVRMAADAGVSQHQLAAAGRGRGCPPDVLLAANFARAVLGNRDDLDALIDSVRQTFGERGLTGLALAVATAQVYPLLKRGMGHAQECVMLPAALREEPDPNT